MAAAGSAGSGTPVRPGAAVEPVRVRGGVSGAGRGWPLPVPDVSGLLPGLYAVNVASFRCLAAPGGSGPVSQRRCVLDGAYRWKLVPVSLDGRFKFENDAAGRCLVPAGRFELSAGTCGDSLGDTWRL
jgi:hypothetical protein